MLLLIIACRRTAQATRERDLDKASPAGLARGVEWPVHSGDQPDQACISSLQAAAKIQGIDHSWHRAISGTAMLHQAP